MFVAIYTAVARWSTVGKLAALSNCFAGSDGIEEYGSYGWGMVQREGTTYATEGEDVEFFCEINCALLVVMWFMGGTGRRSRVKAKVIRTEEYDSNSTDRDLQLIII